MPKRILTVFLLLGWLMPLRIFGQTIFNGDREITVRDQLLYNLKYAQTEPDTFEFEYHKSPGLAFLLSAALPGAGEFYVGAKYRAAAFVSIEMISWLVYFNRKNAGENMETSYEKFADTHWNIGNWYVNSIGYTDYFGINREGFGSHSIWIEYNGLEYEAKEETLNQYIPGWDLTLIAERNLPYSDKTIREVRTRDYYENIGKYNQFATGWDDFNIALLDTNRRSPVKNSPRREKYLDDRYASNQAFKMATNFATVIMFNHLFSAFHAQIAAKHYRPPEEKAVSWHVGLVTDIRRRQPITGLSFSLAF